jgi:hypothetical protein
MCLSIGSLRIELLKHDEGLSGGIKPPPPPEKNKENKTTTTYFEEQLKLEVKVWEHLLFFHIFTDGFEHLAPFSNPTRPQSLMLAMRKSYCSNKKTAVVYQFI